MNAGRQHYQDHWRSFSFTRSHLTQQEGPDIRLLEPALQKQWDHAANAHLGNILITPHTNRKVSWTCDQCPDDHLHSWSAGVNSRSNGNGCPQCIGRKVCRHSSLATKAPWAAAQWDYEANDGTPDTVVSQSCQKLGWCCDVCSHKWTASPHHRVSKGTGCPECARFKKWTRRPTFASHPLLAEWDHRRNAANDFFPANITLGSAKQIFWLCHKCPAGQLHSWSAPPYSRAGRFKAGCPVCAGQVACRCNSLQALYPDIAAEWDYSNNTGQPSDYPASSDQPVWWSSPRRGSWQQSIHSRSFAVQQRSARLKRIQERQAPGAESHTNC